MAGTLQGRVAIVTGGGHGIGRATALALAGEGATVVVFERDATRCREVEAELRRCAPGSAAVDLDVGDADAFGRAIDGVAARHGRLDIVVNNAAGPGWAPFADLSPAQWDACFAVSSRAHFVSAKAAAPHLARGGGGSIVGIASAHALVSGPGFAAHAAAKASILGLTRALATELGPLGIRVNAICPGAIMTGGPLPPDIHALAVQCYPVGRLGRPEDIAAGVLYLCSDAASFVTGIALPIDGGLTALNAEHVAYKPALEARRGPAAGRGSPVVG